jgi:hypothetical protein
MYKNKDAYMDYVCPNCMNTLDNCICDTIQPPYYLIMIDRNIQEHIRILNQKGYYTRFCCEGHEGYSFNTYIVFVDDYFENIDMPNKFKYSKKDRKMSYIYSARLSDEKFRELKKENIAILLDWCNSLPNRNMEN